jgi:hypothetical protein
MPWSDLFERLAPVATGGYISGGSLPDGPRFAATLLLVRKLMHHLRIATIALRG